MATNGAQQVFAPVLAAHSTMSSGADRTQKEQAHQYLEQFQKSVWHQRIGQWSSVGWRHAQEEAWTMTLAMLEANNVDAAAKLFAATTLKGKVGKPAYAIPWV
jgi:transportin-3